jgi:hypothetical protein
MYIIVCVFIIIYPVIFYFVFDEIILHFAIEIPALDWKNSWIAYAVNYFHHCIILTTFTLGSIPSISAVVIYTSTAFAHFDILISLLEELDKLTVSKIEEKEVKIKAMIKMIIEHHMELIK